MINQTKLRNFIKGFLSRSGYTISRLNVEKHPQHLNQISAQQFFDLYFSMINKSNFFFVQFGANDGSFVDPLYKYIRKYDLSGILVEPQKDVFEKLKQNYINQNTVKFANIAISNTDGEQPLFTVNKVLKQEDGFFNRMTGIASFNKELLIKSLKYELLKKSRNEEILHIEDYIEETPVKTLTFISFIEKFDISKIDFIQMDCEGFDYEIIKMIDLDSITPKVINYESTHLSADDRKECEELLQSKGYQIFRHGFDTCAFK